MTNWMLFGIGFGLTLLGLFMAAVVVWAVLGAVDWWEDRKDERIHRRVRSRR